jgi:hypothetical protein
MIIYEATKEEFMNHVTEDSIAVRIHDVLIDDALKTLNARSYSVSFKKFNQEPTLVPTDRTF